MNNRPVFFVSDSTGITAETLGHSLLTQFEDIRFDLHHIRFIDSVEKAQHAQKTIQAAAENSQLTPLVFSTVVDEELRNIVSHGDIRFFDFMDAFVHPLEKELGERAKAQVGHSHGVVMDTDYLNRMDAVNYALKNDDGGNIRHYDKADVVIIGVSRSGKTPTCLYLGLHHGLYAANYPFVDDDLDNNRLPKALEPFRHKLFGLNISAERLQQIRQGRRPDSKYASLHQCQYEVRQMAGMYRQFGIPSLDVTRLSVEEIATSMLDYIKPGA